MEKDFIPYEQALTLKELGFDEPCCANMFDYSKPNANTNMPNRIRYFGADYSENFNKEYDFGVVGYKDIFVSIPLYQQAFRWFREKCNLLSFIHSHPIWKSDNIYFEFVIESDMSYSGYKSYEEAELECLKKLIEIVKNK